MNVSMKVRKDASFLFSQTKLLRAIQDIEYMYDCTYKLVLIVHLDLLSVFRYFRASP